MSAEEETQHAHHGERPYGRGPRHCSGSGGRAALAGKTLLDLGFKDVRNLGGFKDWVNAGGSVAGLRIARDDGLPLQIGARSMTINVIALQPLVALVAGILILIIPRLLNFIVAIYLIIIGVTGLWPQLLH
ncbi:MAG TPA: DUF3096 domain-containing protein [Acetobacteraceae bacterium]|jgi:hypothetical protein|nr:DUF3096 domain-containing protein [Acetobacteraceae bacterium]